MAFWVWAAAEVALTIAKKAVDSYTRKANPYKRGTLSDFTIPTVEPGTPIPRVYGKVRIDSPIVGWYGDLNGTEITDNGAPAGYRYFMGMQLILCSGPDVTLEQVIIDDKVRPILTRSQRTGYQQIKIDTTNLRDIPGGPTVNENHLAFYPGSTDQPMSAYLAHQANGDVSRNIGKLDTAPAYRGWAHMILGEGTPRTAIRPTFYVGDSTSAKMVAAVVSRYPRMPGDNDQHRIGDDANPACCIFDELIQARIPYNGAELDISEIDIASLQAMATTLYNEGLGISISYAGGSPLDHVDDILRHVDGFRYEEPSTGKMTFGLTRADYDTNTLPVFQVSSIDGFKVQKRTFADVPNSVRITYTDLSKKDRQPVASAQNGAAIDVRGRVDYLDLLLPGLTTDANGQKAADRAIRTVCWPLTTCQGYLDRSAWNLRKGSLIKINWSPDGISNLIVRLTQCRIGSARDSKIYFEAVEDPYAIERAIYSPPPASGFLPPAVPDAPAALALIETPSLVPYARPLMPDERATGLLMVARGAVPQDGYVALIRDQDLAYRDVSESRSFTPRAVLSGAMDEKTSTVFVTSAQDITRIESVSQAEMDAGRNVMLIGSELIAFRSIRLLGGSTYMISGVVRGCVDTMPATHSVGASVWFVSYGATRIPLASPALTEYSRTTVVAAQPFSPAGRCPIGSLTPVQVTVPPAPRGLLPAPPCLVLLNGSSYPTSIHAGLSVSWRHRNRWSPSPFGSANATSAPEPGVTYHVIVYGEAGTIIRQESGITGTSWSYDPAQEIVDSGLGRLNNVVRVKLGAERDGLVSWQIFDWTVGRS